MMLNKWVNEIKDFGILVDFGLPPLLSLDGDVLIVEHITNSIRRKVQTSTKLPVSSAMPMADDIQQDIFPLS